MKNVIGVGMMLETPQGTYLLQERDHNTSINPGRIAPFGGGVEGDEDLVQCAQRELVEELALEVSGDQLQTIGLFQSRYNPNNYLHMFLVKEVELSDLNLQEGASIVELSKESAIADERVTDFTKEVLMSI